MTAIEIENCLQQNLAGAIIEVAGDDGVHFSARIISEEFAGKNRVQRHRIVYKALGDKMKADIHALALETLTAEEVVAK
jgi:acid stress-induced BolA-like protein IbaG/YrbA